MIKKDRKHVKYNSLAVDLGLPSGTKWAYCNVGADKPEEHGAYFAWGETIEKDCYDWQTYIYSDDCGASCHHLGCICGTKYDAARIILGEAWQMPSQEQFNELIDNTTYEWMECNGINGGKFIGPNGNFIFLPAAGGYHGSTLYTFDLYGFYWSGMQNPNNNDAYILHFDSCFADWCSNNWYRKVGLPIRPVLCKIYDGNSLI